MIQRVFVAASAFATIVCARVVQSNNLPDHATAQGSRLGNEAVPLTTPALSSLLSISSIPKSSAGHNIILSTENTPSAASTSLNGLTTILVELTASENPHSHPTKEVITSGGTIMARMSSTSTTHASLEPTSFMFPSIGSRYTSSDAPLTLTTSLSNEKSLTTLLPGSLSQEVEMSTFMDSSTHFSSAVRTQNDLTSVSGASSTPTSSIAIRSSIKNSALASDVRSSVEGFFTTFSSPLASGSSVGQSEELRDMTPTISTVSPELLRTESRPPPSQAKPSSENADSHDFSTVYVSGPQITTHKITKQPPHSSGSYESALAESSGGSNTSLQTQGIAAKSDIASSRITSHLVVASITAPSFPSPSSNRLPMMTHSKLISSSYSPASQPFALLSTSYTASQTTPVTLKGTMPARTGYLGTSDELISSSDPAVSPALRYRPENTTDGYVTKSEMANSDLAASSITRAALALDLLQSPITYHTSSIKLAVETDTTTSTVLSPESTLSGTSASWSGYSLPPDATLSLTAGRSKIKPSNPPSDGERPERVDPTDNSTPGGQHPQDNKKQTQDQQASTIGIATGAVSASVMCGIIIYLIFRHYKAKSAYQREGADIFGNSSQESFDSGTSSRPVMMHVQRQNCYHTINATGLLLGNDQEKPRRPVISRPLAGGNSLGL